MQLHQMRDGSIALAGAAAQFSVYGDELGASIVARSTRGGRGIARVSMLI